MAVSRANVPVELHDRYGLKPKNPIFIGALWLFAFFVIGSLFFLANGASQTNVETRLISWKVLSSTEVEISWTVYQRENKPVFCTIKAQDADQFDVGYALYLAENTSSVAKLTQTLKTSSSAFAVLTPICELDQSRLLGPHFRPGLLPPAQEAPLFAPWQWIS